MSLSKRAFNLARRGNNKKVREIPVFPHLKEAPPRKGFLEDGAYRKVVEDSPVWFRTTVEVGRKFAWRISEVLNLRVEQVDLFGRTFQARSICSWWSAVKENGLKSTSSLDPTANPFGIFAGPGGGLAFVLA